MARRNSSSAGLIVGWVVLGLIGLVILSGVFAAFGTAAAASLLAAVLPAPLLIAIVLMVDRYEPEPKHVLATTFLYGATAAVVLSVIVSAVAIAVFGMDRGLFFQVSVVAPVVEETVKCLAVLVVFWRLRDQFNGVIDGVVYSAMVGLGFAVTENVLYYGEALVADSGAFAVTVIMRGVVSPFAHPLFTSLFGIGLAMATESARARVVGPILGWLGAMFLHSLWNTAALTGPGFIGAYVLFFVPVFVVVVVVTIVASRREERLLRTHLAEEVTRGLLTPDEFEKLASVRRRRAAERESARMGGAAAKDRRRAFHAAATRLAFLRHRRRAGALHAPTAEEEARQLEEVARAKAAAKGGGWQPAPGWGPEGEHQRAGGWGP